MAAKASDQTDHSSSAEQRQRSPMERLLGRFHVYGVFWYQLPLFAARYVPKWSYYFLTPLFALFFFIVLRRIRRNIAVNFEAVLGPCGFFERQRRIWRNILTYSWCLIERYEDLATDRRSTVEVEGMDVWRDALVDGGGMLVVTAHIGHWEIASAYPADHHGRTIHVVRETEINPASQEVLKELIERRSKDGYHVHFARRAGDLGPKLLLALRDGDIVALQGDRPARHGRTLETRLFDRPLSVPMGPAAMARAAEAPILPVFIYRTGRSSSKVVFRPMIRIEKTADRDGDLQRVVDGISAEVEAAIRADPFQWFCFVDLWPDRPTGDAEPGSRGRGIDDGGMAQQDD